ncbi:MAG: DUF4349 domain-containing protein [Clostridiales bacterium]|nr:DUF4349 domain-containing protein [Clostridiales bacterium]
MIKRIGIIGIIVVLLTALLTGCGRRSASDYSDSKMKSTVTSPQAPAEEKPADIGGGAQNSVTKSNENIIIIDPNRKLIRTGELQIESLDFDTSLKAVDTLLAKLKGYIESSGITGVSKLSSGVEQMRSADLTVRVPSKQFDAFLSGSGSIGNVLLQSTSGQDVTDFYYDTQARLKSQQMMEQRLLALLSKSDRLTDIISLEKSLADTRYEIEKLIGNLKKWDQLIEYSTFQLHIQEVQKISAVSPNPKTLGQKISGNFIKSLRKIHEDLIAFVIFLAGALPYIVILGIIFVLMWFPYVKMRRTNKKWNPMNDKHQSKDSSKIHESTDK